MCALSALWRAWHPGASTGRHGDVLVGHAAPPVSPAARCFHMPNANAAAPVAYAVLP